MKKRRWLGAALVMAAMAAGAAGCSSGSDSASVDDAWARASVSTANAGAVYMTIEGGNEDDRLVGVSVDSAVAGMAQIHEAVMQEAADGTSMMTMISVQSVAIPSGGSVTFEPGGYHVMLMNLAEPLQASTTIEVSLAFEKAGTVEVVAEVREG